MSDTIWFCIYCGRSRTDSDNDICRCFHSPLRVEIWRALDNVTYRIEYPSEQDPVQLGIHGNLSRAQDLLLDSWIVA